jgi:Lipid A 3-O-deacylase (PagL)
LASCRDSKSVFALRRSKGCLARNLRLCCLSGLAAVCLFGSQAVQSQRIENSSVTSELPAADSVVIPRPIPDKRPVESEISVMAMIPDGDYRLFSATVRCNAWTIGVEYDRHSWGHLLKSQLDYVVEVLPIVLLSQPAVSDFWGNAKSPNQQMVPGVSLSPFGFRTLWRSGKAIRPFVVGKLGTAVFSKKALSPNASYANFNVQAAFGVQIRLTERVDLRLDPFEFFHVSNGYLAASNPGMDELGTRYGITYHLGRTDSTR